MDVFCIVCFFVCDCINSFIMYFDSTDRKVIDEKSIFVCVYVCVCVCACVCVFVYVCELTGAK